MSKENLLTDESMSVAEQELLSLIEKVESNPQNKRINPADFINHTAVIKGQKVNLFPQSEVEADLARVEESRTAFLKKAEKGESFARRGLEAKAALVESMLPELIRELSWLGEQVKVINTSLYDDYFNKIDSAVQLLPDREIKDERDIQCVGFSLDFTLSQEEAHRKILDQAIFLCRGRIPKMKYFQADIKTSQGEKTIRLKDFKIPHVILVCAGNLMDDSIDDLMAYEKSKDNSEVKDRLEDCDLKFYFIRETIAQLIFFAELLEKFIALERAGNNDQRLISQYERAVDIYDKALRQLIAIVKDLGYDSETVRAKIKHIPSPTDKFNLNTPQGKQLLDIIRSMSQQ